MPTQPSDFQMIAANPAGGEDPASYGFGAELQNAMAPSMGRAPSPQQGYGETELNNALSNMRQFQARIVATQEAAKRPSPPDEITIKKGPDGKGVAIVKTTPENLEATMNSANSYHTLLGGYVKQLDAIQGQLAAEEQNIRNQPPWVQLATALSANLAQAKDMPGWVQGLGRTAEQLNPRAEMIQAKRVKVLQDQAALAEKGAALDIAEDRNTIARGERAQSQTASAETQRLKRVEDARNNVTEAIKVGEGRYDPEIAQDLLQKAGATEEEVKTSLANFGMLSKNVSGAYNAKRADAAEAQRLGRESSERSNKYLASTLATVGGKAEDKKAIDEALEETAKSLAAGDLTSIKDVASMRTHERLLLFARIRKLNPNFNTAEVDRKIKTEQLFTVGKEGEAIKSFDTFLQHAGELTEAVRGISQTGSPAVNKPINWLRKNVAGNPEYQRLLVAIEPVGKEFESFLLNQRALYDDDRKQLKILLSADSRPEQILAAVNQMGKTAKDRFVAMNKRYKGVMKRDIENPFSDDAITSATKIGVNLETPQTAKTVEVSEDELKKLGFK